MVRQERGYKAVQREIAEEREKVEHLAGIEGFDTEGLPKVLTLEPLLGAELLQRELTQKAVTKELGASNRGGMKPFVREERIVRPDTATPRERGAGAAESESFQPRGPPAVRERGAGTAGSKSCQRQDPPGAREQELPAAKTSRSEGARSRDRWD